jgi:cellulose synthase/poly-beta-1,6-N-acetylglucosamine synthase-like glycosyltransferase
VRNTRNPKAPSVSVVIPHQGPDDCLESCLGALRNQDDSLGSIQILVVLNEASRRDLSINLHPGEELLWQPHYFSYAARNLGIAHAKGDIIAFTDSDTIPDRHWLRAGVDAITAGADLVAGQINLTFSRALLSPAACYEKLFAFDQEKNVTAGYSTTANLFVRSSLVTTVGLFDEHAHTGEDFEWSRKTVASGAQLVYSSTAIVSHPARESMGQLFAKAKRTSSLFMGVSIATNQQASILQERLRHQLLVAPSSSKRIAMRPTELVLAHAVRLILIAYKALRVLRGGPAPQTEVPSSPLVAPKARAS